VFEEDGGGASGSYDDGSLGIGSMRGANR